MGGDAHRNFGVYEKGKKISATGLNNMAGRLDELTPFVSLDGTGALSLPGGTGLTNPPREADDRPRIGYAIIPAWVTSQESGRIGVYRGGRLGMMWPNQTGDVDSFVIGGPPGGEDLRIYNPNQVSEVGGDSLSLPCPAFVAVGPREDDGLLMCIMIPGAGGGGSVGAGTVMGQYYVTVANHVAAWNFPFLTD